MEVPNADPFHDTLGQIRDLAREKGVPVDDCKLMINDDVEATDFTTILYDLNITDGTILNFVWYF